MERKHLSQTVFYRQLFLSLATRSKHRHVQWGQQWWRLECCKTENFHLQVFILLESPPARNCHAQVAGEAPLPTWYNASMLTATHQHCIVRLTISRASRSRWSSSLCVHWTTGLVPSNSKSARGTCATDTENAKTHKEEMIVSKIKRVSCLTAKQNLLTLI